MMAWRGSNCGTTDGSSGRIELDHVDPTTKTVSVSTMLDCYSDERITEELSKTQPLCRECHKAKVSIYRTSEGSTVEVKDIGVGKAPEGSTWIGFMIRRPLSSLS